MAYQTKIDLADNIREKVVALLNARLADAIDLQLQSKQAHWNVKGPSFIALHELFDTIAGNCAGHADLLAERVTALGGTALGTVQVIARETALAAYPIDIGSGQEHLHALSSALAAFGKRVRVAIDESASIGDADTADVFTEISRAVDKDLWFVEAHIQSDR